MFRDEDPEDEQAHMLSPEWKKPSPDTLTSASGPTVSKDVKLNNFCRAHQTLARVNVETSPS